MFGNKWRLSQSLKFFMASYSLYKGGMVPLEIISTLENLSSLKQLLISNNEYKSDLIFQSFYLFP